ncbi:MAG: DUF4402 domain-containing protein [Pseudomonadota bacterium]
MRMFFKFCFVSFMMPVVAHAVDVTAATDVITALVLTVDSTMQIPTVYTTTSGLVTSEQSSSIPGGTDGHNATITIRGEPNKQYSLSFAGSTLIKNVLNQTLTVTLSMGTGGGAKTGRIMPGGGIDTTSIRGGIAFNGTQPRGSYSNSTTPVAVTATYDDV